MRCRGNFFRNQRSIYFQLVEWRHLGPRHDWKTFPDGNWAERRARKSQLHKRQRILFVKYIFRRRRRNSIPVGLYAEWNVSEIKREKSARPNLRRRLNFRFCWRGRRTATSEWRQHSNRNPHIRYFDLFESLWYTREMTPEAGGIAIRQEEVLLVCRATLLLFARDRCRRDGPLRSHSIRPDVPSNNMIGWKGRRKEERTDWRGLCCAGC